MKNIILRRMKERVERSREASDGEYFDELLLLAELLLKLVTRTHFIINGQFL